MWWWLVEEGAGKQGKHRRSPRFLINKGIMHDRTGEKSIGLCSSPKCRCAASGKRVGACMVGVLGVDRDGGKGYIYIASIYTVGGL